MSLDVEPPLETASFADVEACIRWLDTLDGVGEEQPSCAGCHFWHFGCCVHVARIGTVGDGRCGHRKDAHPIF